MKTLSIIAVMAALAMPAAAMAQDASVGIDLNVSGEVTVSTPDVGGAVSSALSPNDSASSSEGGGVGVEVSAGASTSAEMSSEASSAMSSELASGEQSASGSGDEQTCDDLDMASMALVAVDQSALDAVTSVTVFAVDDCSGIGGLAGLDAGALAALQGNEMVTDALADQADVGAEIIAYTLDDTSLTVYVRDRD